MHKANEALKLTGARNVRDLGGYPAQGGKTTRWKQFLRADNPSRLTLEDCEALYQYGVRLQIDLRSHFETKQHPSMLQKFRGIDYHNIQLFDGLNSNTGAEAMPDTLGEVYVQLLDHSGPRFAEMLRLMLDYPEDCVLFNCTAGKDRTGTTAMLLLKLAGCEDEMILADYAATYENIRPDMERTVKLYADKGLTVDMAMLRSDPEEMEKALSHLQQAYGGVQAWMESIGLTPAQVEGLKQKLIG